MVFANIALQTLKTAEQICGHVQQLSGAKKRLEEACFKYKNIADEAVIDRRLVLMQLKKVQDEWRPSVHFNQLQEDREMFKHMLEMYDYLERRLPPELLATAVFEDLSVEHISSLEGAMQGFLMKHSVKGGAFSRL